MAKRRTAGKAAAKTAVKAPTVTPVAEVKTEEAKVEEVKAEEVKTEEVKTEEVKAEEVKTEETAKEIVKEAAEAVKETVKETAQKAVKKATTAKKAPAKEKTVLQPELFVQFDDAGAGPQEAGIDDIVAKIKAAYVAEGHRESSIKSLRVYFKPQEWKAYYVINEKIHGDIKIF